MPITLTADLEYWIAARVEEGELGSLEDGVRRLVEERIAERDLEDDELAWAKPLIDEGLAAIERGEFVSLEEFRRRTAKALAGKPRM